MPVTKAGIVYYADDPHKRVFRVIFPQLDDSELDAPCPTALDGNGKPMAWTDFGVDKARPRIMEKVEKTDARVRLTGVV